VTWTFLTSFARLVTHQGSCRHLLMIVTNHPDCRLGGSKFPFQFLSSVIRSIFGVIAIFLFCQFACIMLIYTPF